MGPVSRLLRTINNETFHLITDSAMLFEYEQHSPADREPEEADGGHVVMKLVELSATILEIDIAFCSF